MADRGEWPEERLRRLLALSSHRGTRFWISANSDTFFPEPALAPKTLTSSYRSKALKWEDWRDYVGLGCLCFEGFHSTSYSALSWLALKDATRTSINTRVLTRQCSTFDLELPCLRQGLSTVCSYLQQCSPFWSLSFKNYNLLLDPWLTSALAAFLAPGKLGAESVRRITSRKMLFGHSGPSCNRVLRPFRYLPVAWRMRRCWFFK